MILVVLTATPRETHKMGNITKPHFTWGNIKMKNLNFVQPVFVIVHFADLLIANT